MPYPLPVPELAPDTFAFETVPLIKPTGFREYDARWLFGKEINLMGVHALGHGLGRLLAERNIDDIITGHDYRSYSSAIKHALITGLMGAGRNVHDIGLCLTPMAYYAQFALDVAAVAMVTASHNENGWTGVKMGAQAPLTFGPDDMTRLRDLVLHPTSVSDQEPGRARTPGTYSYHDNFFARHYQPDLLDRPAFTRPIKVVAACGNGTAGAFVPQILAALGAEVVPMDCEPDATFARYNPNPEDMVMLKALRAQVRHHQADIGLAFDGDGDRCGVVDNEGVEIFADKVGVLLARDLSRQHNTARFVVDVKSTGLFATDPVLRQNGARTGYWKTGHSYIKRRVQQQQALAGFEKSGHYFFNAPIGRGYDDGLVAAIAILDMLDRAAPHTMADLRRTLPQTWGTPTMSPGCPDERKYDVVARIRARLEKMRADGQPLGGHPIADLVDVNGVRVMSEDGTWGLVRASSNAPQLVVVAESPVSAERLRQMFDALDGIIREHDEVAEYNQTF